MLNVAGVSAEIETVEKLPGDDWGRIMRTGVDRRSCPRASPSSAVDGLARVTALDWAYDRISVVALASGGVDTPRVEEALGRRRATTDMLGFAVNPRASGRVGQPEEIAAALSWLASDKSSFITRPTLLMDGEVPSRHGRTTSTLRTPVQELGRSSPSLSGEQERRDD
jgi:hypothetical protein